MKYAFMSFSCPDLNLSDMLALAKRLGYDGVEPRLVAQHKHGIETTTSAAERRAIKDQVAASGVPLVCLATSCVYADPAKAADMVAETRRCIDLAADIGCSRLRVFGGPIPKGVTREQAMDSLVTSFAAVADQAGERGVAVCMETHDDWTNPDHVAEVMRRVNRPAIAVNWDIMHPVRQSKVTMDQAFNTVRPWIKHVHFHDGADIQGNLVLKPIGEGIVDHRRAVELLLAMPYTGYLSGEWIAWEPYEVHLPRELAAMRRFESAI